MMKVPTSVRQLYQETRESYAKLQESVDRFFDSRRRRVWHYESRVKELESFALKIETGRFDPAGLEDFFACTLVVENASSIAEAEALVSDRFRVKYRRPSDDRIVSKHSDCFRFDDLRIYVEWTDPGDVPPSGLNGLLFEVQVKTYLQHAWAIATHDLVFKTDQKSWAKERIAFQVKAMLEHAEIAIREAELLSTSPSLDKTDRGTAVVAEVLALLQAVWPPEALPADRKRLSETVAELLQNLDLSPESLRAILAREGELGRGAQTLNLSPFGIVVQSILLQQPELLLALASSNDRKAKRLFVYPEIDAAGGPALVGLRNVVSPVRMVSGPKEQMEEKPQQDGAESPPEEMKWCRLVRWAWDSEDVREFGGRL